MPSVGEHKKKPMRQKHIPQRMCAICRETGDKRSLIRVVRTSETSFEIDPTGRANGRGAYICDTPSCWEKATSTPILAKALRVTPDQQSIEKLKEFAAGLNLEAVDTPRTVSSKEKAS